MKRLPAKEPLLAVLVVEDEAYTRESLVEGIDWAAAGCRVVGAVEGGEEALGALTVHGVDIIVSDIRMDGMDGIELCKRCRDEYPDIGFVFLTGYGELEYAREALRNRAWDFLLKPTQPEELENTLLRLAEKIRENRAERECMDSALKTASLAKNVLRRCEVRACLLGTPQPDSGIVDKQEQAQRYSVLVVQLTDPKDWAGLLTDIAAPYDSRSAGKVVAAAAHVFTGEWEWVVLAPDRLALIVWQESVAASARDLAEHLQGHLRLPSVCGLSRPRCRIDEVFDARREAERALRERFGSTQGQVFRYQEPLLAGIPGAPPAAPSGSGGIRAALIGEFEEAVRTGDTAEAETVLDRIAASTHGGSSMDAAEAAAEILFLLQRASIDRTSAMEPPSGLDVVLSARDVEGMWSQVRTWTRLVAERIGATPRGGLSELAARIIAYVHAHYREPVGVVDAARHCNRNEKHVARTLKHEVGMTFTELLTEVRLRHAEVLLGDESSTVGEVAFGVGFGDPAYFSRAFRKSRGCSPSEYRRSLIGWCS